MVNVGKINEFIVLRKSDLGYMLGHKDEQVLLHFRQATRELQEGEKIHAFVFFDSKGRLSASLDEPVITLDNSGWVTVVEVSENLGVFIDNNCFKDVLVSKDYLPFDFNLWPKTGDKLLAQLKLKGNKLSAKPLNKYDILELYPLLKEHQIGEVIDVTIVRASDKAYNAVSSDECYIFIPIKQARDMHRLGEAVSVTILGRHDDEYVGSLNQAKEELMEVDSLKILDYLNNNDKKLQLTAKSPSEEIEKYFNMSRKAFKRAIGALYKEKRIYFDECFTYLKDEKKDSN